MRKSPFAVLVFFAAALALRSGAPAHVEAGTTIVLKVGRCAVVGPQDATLCFERVVEDSRCPKGAMCIRAGNARIAVRVTSKDGRTDHLDLNTAEGPTCGVGAGLEIELLSVDPYPVVHQPVDPKAYTATFSVTAVKK